MTQAQGTRAAGSTRCWAATRKRRTARRSSRSCRSASLRPGKYQPRTRMDEASLAELAESIKARGVIQPIVVRAGRRRRSTRSSPASAAGAPRASRASSRCPRSCARCPTRPRSASASSRTSSART